MNTPLSWIKEMVPGLDCTPAEYMDAMTLSGTKAESAQYFDKNLDKIIVGRINKIERHPDADKLVICQVQIDEDGKEIQIVTGAPNAFEGAVVPVVLEGGRVACDHSGNKPGEGFVIKAGKLRGVDSAGMMCSIDEFGRDKTYYPEADEEGLYIFNKIEGGSELKLGSDALIPLGLRDALVEYEVTSNRVDCFGIEGIAREAAATFRKEFKPPVIKETGNAEKAEDFISVEIKDKELCKRYVARVVKNVKIAPSPLWMQRKLSAVGIRPINNIVDITNYVMTELSQPMHAYDIDTIEERKIVVERAANGEKFTTLDGVERELDDTVLLIKDGKKAVGIAGIMGGENSKINEGLNTVLLEAACFDGTNIRLSSKKIGLRTDASGKFEKGLHPETALLAMNRACTLIEEIGAGEVVGGVVDVYPVKEGDREVEFDLDACNRLLGTSISLDMAREYFDMLGIKINDDLKSVVVPYFRQDLLRNADLAEELARFFGYDKIPTTLPSGESTAGGETFGMEIEGKARELAEQFGFCEGMTFSFESPKVFDRLLLPLDAKEREAIEIKNPLGEDYSIMRTQIINGMLTSLGTNSARRNKNVRLYEISNIYLAKQLPLEDYPEERKQFCLGMYGEGDFFVLKGVIEEFLYKVGMKKLPSYNADAGKTFLHPGRQAQIIYEDTVVGYFGEVHPLVQEAYGIAERTYVANIDLSVICKKANFTVKYEGIAKFPSVVRDISLVMDKSLTAGEIEKIIRSESGAILESLELFDIYEGERIGADKKSMAYSITFRNKEKTLEESEISAVMDKILKGLQTIGAVLRS
jgi:phenylalanine--tRNA ligase, beta subunit